MPSLQLDAAVAPLRGYRAFFYCRDYGDLEDVVGVESFDAGVQLVRDRLTPNDHYLIEATWAERVGEMTVSTPRGTVLARVEIDDSDTPAAKPDVLRARGAPESLNNPSASLCSAPCRRPMCSSFRRASAV